MNVNVVITGHVDHGKSTLIGRLLYDSDSIKEGRVEEIQKIAEEYKKHFEFAYFLDSFDDELKEERTIDTTGVMFKGKNLYVITDVPGHKEFIKNMLTGASHADVAVLVVAADQGVQEQTGRHAFLIHMLGVQKLLVVINKLDAVGYAEAAFEAMREKVGLLLGSLGYRDVRCIPASAVEGDNIYKRSQNTAWYSGPTLIEALDSIELDKETRPPRFVVQDAYSVDGERVVVGRVESGSLRQGDEIVFQPSGERGRIEKIKVYPDDIYGAETGDSVGIVCGCAPMRGDVGGPAGAPPKATTRFLGQAVLLDGLSAGETLELRCGTRRVRCMVEEMREKIDSETGAVIETQPRHIGEHEAATLVFATEPLVVERFADIPALGRFILVRGKNIAAGVVLGTTA